jgi:hypothetical protein
MIVAGFEFTSTTRYPSALYELKFMNYYFHHLEHPKIQKKTQEQTYSEEGSSAL